VCERKVKVNVCFVRVFDLFAVKAKFTGKKVAKKVKCLKQQRRNKKIKSNKAVSFKKGSS